MAGTLHGVHAITSRIAPVPKSSGVQIIESESFKMTIHMTLTGACACFVRSWASRGAESLVRVGIKFVLISSVDMANAESILQKIYEACKSPFPGAHHPKRDL